MSLWKYRDPYETLYKAAVSLKMSKPKDIAATEVISLFSLLRGI